MTVAKIMRRTFCAILLGAVACVAAADTPNLPPRKDYAEIVQTLRPFIQREMADKQIPALSIAIVDDQQRVWAEGFGFADSKTKTPATAETVYRIGSVSKLFTDIGIMQLAERGELNLDAPITDYLPDFHPKNPFGTPITLRQMMSHRSGLLREPPVGNYFEPNEPSLAATVRSLNETELVFDYKDWQKYPILNVTFDRLASKEAVQPSFGSLPLLIFAKSVQSTESRTVAPD